jgi:hypothetical protein
VAAKTRIVRIGHSRGIRIPKTLLDESDLFLAVLERLQEMFAE